jgi:predicted transcriptional regulator
MALADAGRLWQDSGKLEALAMSTVKEELTRLIQGQPDDSSREEIVRELAFHVMVERGLADSDAKRTISNEEMGRRIRSWQQ